MFQASKVSQVPAILVVHHKVFNISLPSLWICFDSEVAPGFHILDCGALVCSNRAVGFRTVTNFGNPTVP